MQREEWKPILGFEEEYEVSNRGRVWSIVSKKLLTPEINIDGYVLVHLSSKRMGIKNKQYRVHRLVYQAFVRKIEQNEEINHIDHCRSNNNLENLQALDKSYHRSMHNKNIPKSEDHKQKLWQGRQKYFERKRREKEQAIQARRRERNKRLHIGDSNEYIND